MLAIGSDVFRQPGDRYGDDRLARFERAVLGLHGAILVAMAAFMVLPLMTAPHPSAVMDRLIVALTYLAIAVDLQLRGERREHLVILLLPLLIIPIVVARPVAGDVSSGFVVTAFILSAARLLHRRWYVVSILLVAGLALGMRGWSGSDLSAGIDDLLIAIGLSSAGAVIFVDTADRAAHRSIEADTRSREQRAALHQAEAETRAVTEAGRALHDEVLGALRAVVDASGTTTSLRATCAAAAAAVNAAAAGRTTMTSSGSGVADLVRDIQQAAPLELTVSIGPTTPGLALPEAARRALVRATHEALRNAARHSGADRATLMIHDDGRSLHVAVADDGVGLPSEERLGFGIKHSILQPMTRVGGTAEVNSGERGGVVVRMAAPVVEVDTQDALTRAHEQVVRAVGDTGWIGALAWPFGITWTLVALHQSWRWPHPTTSLVLTAAFVATTVVVSRRLLRGPATVGWCVGFVATITVLFALSLALLPAGSLLDYRSWPAGWIAIPVFLAGAVLPGRIATLAVLPLPLLLAYATVLRPELADHAVPWGSVNAVAGLPLFGCLTGAVLRRLGRGIEREDAEYAADSLALATQRSAALVSSVHLDYTRREVVPWLERIASGAVDPWTPASMRRAAVLMVDVRDDLFAPGFFDASLRSRAGAFREKGGTLLLRPGITQGAWNRAVGRVVEAAMRASDGAHTITVTPPGDIGLEARVAIVPALPELSLDVPADTRHDLGRTVIVFDDHPAAPINE